MSESNQPKRKEKESEQEGVINIGDISSISGDMINLTSEDSAEVDVSQQIKTFDVEGSTYIEGSVQTGGGDFVGRDTIEITTSEEEFFRLLMTVNEKIDEESASPEEKDDLHQLIREIVEEAVKRDATDEMVLTRRLRMLGKVSPDVYSTLLDTFGKTEFDVGSVMRSIVSKLQSGSGEGG